jgi:hypothetical protein
MISRARLLNRDVKCLRQDVAPVPRPIRLAMLLPKPRKNIANDIGHIDFFLTFYFLYNKLLIV